ncbi:MAG: cell division protein ZapA [Acidobacteriia bacterium]|nr:cell division protein ZapA [Terriglobia bacterium]
MEIEGQSIRFEIFDKTYTIKGVFEDDYKEKLETFVDHTIREISKRLQTVDRDKIVVTATLNIAHYLFQEQNQNNQKESIEKNVSAFKTKIGQLSAENGQLKTEITALNKKHQTMKETETIVEDKSLKISQMLDQLV